jgi:aspartate kinase
LQFIEKNIITLGFFRDANGDEYMKTLVMKFGGAAVATPQQFLLIAEIILTRSLHYDRLVIVVSAMGNTTDELLKLATQVHPNPPARELDMLVSVGERISIALLSMALASKGKGAISFTGSQAGIITTPDHFEARIVDVRPGRLLRHFDEGKVVIVAGFQGVSIEGEITTLGRGGSDTTAVALGVVLNAEKVEFFKDVAGIYNADPKKEESAFVYPFLNYVEALDIVRKGAKVLHARSIALAAKNFLPLHVLSFNDPQMQCHKGTLVGESGVRKCLFEDEHGL